VKKLLFADMPCAGKMAAYFKYSYLIRFGVAVSQYNAIARNLGRKISSVLGFSHFGNRNCRPLSLKPARLSPIKDYLHLQMRWVSILETGAFRG